MGPPNQFFGHIRETRRTGVFQQSGIQASNGLNTAWRKTKHFVSRAGTLAHRHPKAKKDSPKMVLLRGQRQLKVIAALKPMTHALITSFP